MENIICNLAEDGEDVDVYILGEDNILKRVHITYVELLHLFSGRVMKLNWLGASPLTQMVIQKNK